MKRSSREQMSSPRSSAALRQLASLNGVQTAYVDIFGKRRQASPQALLLTLQNLGAPLAGVEDAPAALRARRQEIWTRLCEPVAVAWEGKRCALTLRVPAARKPASLAVHLELEGGETRSWSVEPAALPLRETCEIEGETYECRELALPAKLPRGYHRLILERPGGQTETQVIAAPRQAYAGKQGQRSWGVFLPLYALHSERSWGAGDFSDLKQLYLWLAQFSGQVVATLPLFASFMDTPYAPSPYAPASRLFWNEFFVDPGDTEEIRQSPLAQELLAESGPQLAQLRAAPLVDYRPQMALKHEVLKLLAQVFFERPGEPPESYRHFIGEHPQVEDYARFRATTWRQGRGWPEWPSPLQEGMLKPGDYEEADRHYHLYVQWLAHTQLAALGEMASGNGAGLYLDLPLGVHPHSYDTWRYRGLFAEKTAVGAPPDTLFIKGQNWGFPPLHPDKIRQEGYRHVIDYLGATMFQAGMLRIDHVMGLHRMFWIPSELETAQGVYVRYPAEELYAIVCLESHRNRCQVVGENLGTVPSYVNRAMARHRIGQMYVVQYELEGNQPQLLREPPQAAVASHNTHDMPPFAAFWRGLDILDRHDLGLVSREELPQKQAERQTLKQRLIELLEQSGRLSGEPTLPAVFRATLELLAASPARLVLVNLEDLWQETEPQNIPGISEERPNWRRKARYSLEQLQELEGLVQTLTAMGQLRQGAAPQAD